MQVQLPATAKASTLEAGADVKKNGLFSGAGHLGDGGIHVLNPISPSQWRQRFFIMKERENQENREGVEKFSTCR